MSSSFGSSPSQQTQPTTSLFANLGTTASQQKAPTPSLFGNISSQTSQPQQSTSSPNLFANLGGSKSQSTPSLFTSVNPNQPQPTSSSGSLFGGITGQSSQQPSQPSLFASPVTNQPVNLATSGGLFGAQSSSQPQQQAASTSIFGGVPQAGTTSAPGASFGPSMLNTPQAAAGSLFGGSAALNTSEDQNGRQHSANGAYFDHLLERGKSRQTTSKGSSQLGDLPSLQLGLGDISNKIRSLGGASSARQQSRGDTRAHYLLAASGVSAGSTLRNLNAFSAEVGATAGPVPTALVDTDIEGYLANQRDKSTLDLIAETIEETKRDFDAFLEQHVQMNWDEQRQRIYEHFGLAKPNESLDFSESSSLGQRGAFGRSSRKTKNAIRSENSPGSKSFGNSGFSKSVLGGSVSKNESHTTMFTDVSQRSNTNGVPTASDDPSVRSKQEKYAAKVKKLNSARLQDIVYPIIEEFGKVESETGNDSAFDLIDSYHALKSITGENSNAHRPSEIGAVKERQYAESYLDEAPNSAQSQAIRKRIITGSRKFLEQQFYQKMEKLNASNPLEAKLGGVPSSINKVRAYLRIRSARKDLGAETYDLQTIGDDYCWALIFYLLRCGLVNEAARYVAENERSIKAMDRNFPQYMAAYARDGDHRLPKDMQTRMNSEYQQRARLAPENSIDPYRMACYKVVGRCDLNKKNLDGVDTTMQDWIWLIFNVAREVNRVEETAADVFGLEEIRSLIEEIGQRHFQQSLTEGSSGYTTYFFLQILAGMFEKAISWLYPHNYVTAVHFGIALDFYGLLRVSDFSVSETDLLTYTTREKPQISFSRMIGYYTRDFRLAKAEAAADYLTLICLNCDLPGNAGRSQSEVCHEALKELVLETREFAQLLGDIRSDGQRIKGAIEQRLNLLKLRDRDQAEFLTNLTTQAAAVADDNGRITDAVLLYHLAEDYDSVIVIINRALSDAIAVEIGQQQMAMQPLKPRTSPEQLKKAQLQNQPASSLSLTSVDNPAVLAKNMITLYNSNALYLNKIRPSHRDACGVLLRMSEAKDAVTAGQWASALDIISSLDLLPIQARSNIGLIRASAQTFNSLPTVVARNIGSLLMWTITCCGRQREVLRNSAFEDRTRRAMADDLLMAAKDLMVFAGLVRYKLPPKVYESLARAGQDITAD